jgi:hypothetical protein
MTPTDSQKRHLRYGRFGRAHQSTDPDIGQGRRRGHWTGYRPLRDAATQSDLRVLMEGATKEKEDQR